VYFLQILKWEFVPGIFVKKEFFYVLLSNFLYAGSWFWSTINNNFNDETPNKRI
jgi:hypothetical protein